MAAKRNALDANDKNILWSIIKDSNGGKFFSALTQGTTTNQQKHDVWGAVGKMFKQETGHDMTAKQLRTLFQRMSTKRKQQHDSAISKQYNMDCSLTGGGKGPPAPAELDGDFEELDDEYDEMDPTPTAFNSLTRSGSSSQFQHSMHDSALSQTPITPQFQLRFPGPTAANRSVERSPFSLLDSQAQAVTASSLFISPNQRAPRLPPSGTQEVLIISEEETMQVQVESDNNSNAKKQNKAKNVQVDAPTKYYTGMFKMQVKSMSLKRKLIRAKLRTEQLKQTLIQNKLSENLIELPTMEPSSESSSEEEDFDE